MNNKPLNLGIMAGVGECDLLADIRAAIPTTGRRVPDSEIMDAGCQGRLISPHHRAHGLNGCRPRVSKPVTIVTSAGTLPRGQRAGPSAALPESEPWQMF